MLTLAALVIATHILVPVVLIGWVAADRANSRLYWLAAVALTLTYLLFMQWAGAGWSWVSFYWTYAFWAALLFAVARHRRRNWRVLPWWPARSVGSWAGFLAVLLAGIFLASTIPTVMTARAYTGEVVDFQFPLSGGNYHVVHGGASPAMNHHYPSPAQRYALDIVRTDLWGLRARGLWSTNTAAYYVWGAAALSPCDGRVTDTENERPDLSPPDADTENVAGNFIAIHCQGVTVILAHLQRGSVTATRGDAVKRGQQVGLVGNSGNTSEPHLHIHAVQGEVTDRQALLWTGRGAPIELDGRFLIRNDRVDN